jgi:RNA polymerase sigma-70 factor (ECF subfamily)
VTKKEQGIEGAGPVAARSSEDDLRLLEALRSGDEAAFVSLLDGYQASLVRLAQVYVRNHAVAEEVVQETWMGVLRGLDGFEGRSSLKTWIFRILVNRAKTHATREARSIPFSSLSDPGADAAELAVDPDRFIPPGHRRSGHWAYPPRSWNKTPEELVLSQETHALIEKAVASLPLRQREVITLRDIEGWTSEEVCALLGITEANQRVLLHRARSKVRRALERHFDEGAGPA